jgi:hypothetical protein
VLTCWRATLDGALTCGSESFLILMGAPAHKNRMLVSMMVPARCSKHWVPLVCAASLGLDTIPSSVGCSVVGECPCSQGDECCLHRCILLPGHCLT